MMKSNRGYIPGAAFTALVAVMAFIIGLVIASNINIFPGDNPAKSIAQENTPLEKQDINNDMQSPFTSIAKQVMPSVVNISAERIVKVRTPLFDFPFEDFFGEFPKELERKAKSLGSGIIYSEDGYILTNNHVVTGADKIIVTLQDNTTFQGKDVEVVGTDPRTDVAILKINAKRKFHNAKFGDSDNIEIGDWAIAFGSPFGFNQTMTVGIISAKGRTHVPLSHGPTYQDFIQTDAAINSGNSGGPLVNINGKVIGINTAIASPSGGNVGIGFAIPINLAKSIANQIINQGRIIRGWLGVSIQQLTTEIAQGLNLEVSEGVIIAKVLQNSPADKAGLKDGDIIVKFDGEKVYDMEKFRFKVAETKPGEKVLITVIRDNRKRNFTVKIGEMPGEEKIAEREEKSQEWLGLYVDELESDSGESGVTVNMVADGSPADEAGIEKGDIIKRIGNIFIHSLSDYYRAKKAYNEYSHITFQIKKPNGYIVFVAIKQ
jgi:serine protease Do